MFIVLDVGANIGLFSISICKRFPQAKIIALEPHPANFRLLVDNVHRAGCAGSVKPLNKGLSANGRSLKLQWIGGIANSAFRGELTSDRGGGGYMPMQTISPWQLWEAAAEWLCAGRVFWDSCP